MGKKSSFFFQFNVWDYLCPSFDYAQAGKGSNYIVLYVFFYEFLIELPDVWIFVYGIK